MTDKYLWLEDISGDSAINWAKETSQSSIQKLKNFPGFDQIEKKALECYGSKEKIPYVRVAGNYVYNLWSDDINPQGLYRRCLIEEYLKEKTKWENLIDLDELSKKENEKWVLMAFELNQTKDRALVFLSPGGSDANIMREFDIATKKFLGDGFFLPLSKGYAHWVDNNTIRIERDFGEETVTTSGYARTVRDWKRGEELSSAKIVFEVNVEAMSAYAREMHDEENEFFILGNQIDFYHMEEYLYEKGQLIKIKLPQMFESHDMIRGQYIVSLKEDWEDYKIGDIIAFNLKTKKTQKIFSPNNFQAVSSIMRTKNGFYAIITEHVKDALYLFSIDQNLEWSMKKITVGENGALNFLAADYENDSFFVSFSSINKPATYYYGKGDHIISSAKSAPSFFDHEDIIVEQHFVASMDGTQIPYFIAYKKDIIFNGKNPTILYGYGGFEISLKPNFNNPLGSSWLSEGGVYVLANIRGGGEYGPKWHQCALKENRHRAYEDFFAIAEDLIAKKITSAKHLGAEGGSNGGLLMGVCYTQRPDLFGAINCMVPLLDMYRYNKLLAGASWMAEYGNPDDEIDGAYIRSISPYQNISSSKKYPVIYLNTSTKDDRVHPGHARKFAAKLMENNLPVYYYENIEGGHGGASNFKEYAFAHALEMSFFWTHLKAG